MGFVIGFVAVAIVLLILNGALQWPGSRQGSLRADPEVTVRLARIERTLRLLESRLDSVEEHQRFLDRLITERADPPGLPPADRPGEEDGPRSILFDVDETEEEER